MNIYSKFSQYYIEMRDEYKGLLANVREYQESGEEIPVELTKEYYRHMTIVALLEKEGKEKYDKEPNELYKEGWDNWFREDKELREKEVRQEMISFVEWDVKSEYKVFSVQKDTFIVAKLLFDERVEFNSVLTFYNKKVYSPRILAEICNGIGAEFGDIEFKIIGG